MINDESQTAEQNDQVDLLILWLLIVSSSNKAEHLWLETKDIVEASAATWVEKYSDICTFVMDDRKTLYRARKLHVSHLKLLAKRNEMTSLEKYVAEKFYFSPNDFLYYHDLNSFFKLLLPVLSMGSESKALEIVGRIKQWCEENKNNHFWGFQRQDSGAPPKNCVNSGRLNRKGEANLYMAEDEHTAIYETRPIIGQSLSVATIHIAKPVRLFDFTAIISDKTDDIFTQFDRSQYAALQYGIIQPNYGDEDHYAPTQCISNAIRKMGYAGIRYPSTIHKNGVNVMLFDSFSHQIEDDACNGNIEITSSKVVSVDNIEIQLTTQLPLFFDS